MSTMYALKGFANNTLYANNTPGTVNVIGELSNQSLTYSREIGQYVSAAAPDITLVTFLSAQDGVAAAVDADFSTRQLAIIEWIYTWATQSSGGKDATQFLEDVLTKFQTLAENFECGAIVGDDTHKIPEWVSWQDTGDTTTGDNFVRIWFSDASFAEQYDEFDIVVIPPIDNLNDFFLAGSVVETEVNARTYVQSMTLTQTAKAGYPETILMAETYDYNDPNNAAHLVPTNWTLLIYGPAGDNIDSIKTALQNYILANSDHSRDEWKPILPDIFKRSEFILVPAWDQYSIPQRVVEAGIHSSFMKQTRVLELLTQYASDYPITHVQTYATSFGHPYKSLGIAVIGSDENRNNDYELVDLYPDWISVSSTSTDFNRQTQDTQDWSELLENLLIAAESMGPATSLPIGLTRLTRNGMLYVVGAADNYEYLVAAKYNFPAAS